MKTIATITAFALCTLQFAAADESKPEPEKTRPDLDGAAIGGASGEVLGGGGIARPIEQVPRREAEPETEAIPKEHAGHKQIAIVLDDLERVGERLAMRATLRIINPTDKPMKFTGYSEKNPIAKIQHLKDGEWVEEERILRCGTGLRPCTIAPGQSAVFKATVNAETMPTRIGVDYRVGQVGQLHTVWSEKIER